jgi:hypothetical protein
MCIAWQSIKQERARQLPRFKWHFFFTISLPAQSGPRPLIQFRNHFFTDGRTSWTSDQPVARPLSKHRTTQTQNKRIHTSNIHDLSGIRTHDSSVLASEDSSSLRPRGYCDRLQMILLYIIYLWLYSPLDLGRYFSFLIYTFSRTPWVGDKPFARPLPTHRTT